MIRMNRRKTDYILHLRENYPGNQNCKRNQDFMAKYERLEHIRIQLTAPQHEENHSYYVHHHVIFKISSTTMRIRWINKNRIGSIVN